MDHDPLCELAGDHSRDECCGNLAKARADERWKTEMEEIGDVIHADRRRQRADLRAEVEALPIILYPISDEKWGAVTGHAVDRGDVFAIIDGSSDA